MRVKGRGSLISEKLASPIARVCVAIACTAVCARGEVVSIIGGTLRVVEGDTAVEATFLGSNSLFTNELFLDSPTFLGPIFVSTSTPTNATASLGTFLPETVLFVRDQSYLPSQSGGPASFNFGWFTGDGSLPLNPDHLPHAVFTWDTNEPAGPVTVRFEDQFGGGDMDFNDAVYSFTNVKVGVVEVALTPTNIPFGDSINNDNAEVRTLSGFGGTFSNSGLITNNGSLYNYGEMDSDGEIQNLQNMLNDLSAHFNNSGTMVNSGTILSFGGFDSSGTFSNLGKILNNGSWINGGDLSNAVGAMVDIAGQGIMENLENFFNDGDVRATGKLVNSGTVSGNGSLIIEAIGRLDNEAGGLVTLANSILNKGALNNENGGTIDLFGSSKNFGTLSNDGDLDNQEGLDNEFGAVLTNLANGVMKNRDAMNNNGTMQNGGVLENFLNAVLTNSGGFTNTGSFQNDGDFESTGTLNNEETGTINSTGTIRISGPLGNLGSIQVSNEFLVELAGQVFNGDTGIMKNFDNLINEGLIDITGFFSNQGNFQNSGNLLLQSGGFLENLQNADLENLADLFAETGSETTNSGILTNSGSLTIEDGASINGEGTFVQNQNTSTTTINGLLEQALLLFNSGKIQGSGTIRGFVNVNQEATLSPGNSPGAMTIDGSMFMTDSTLEIELASSTLFDTLTVIGDVEFDGGIIKYLFEYTPALGDSFAFLTADGDITGLGSTTFQVMGNLGGLSVDTQLIGNSVVMTVIPEPTAAALLAACALLKARRLRSSDRRKVTSTNAIRLSVFH